MLWTNWSRRSKQTQRISRSKISGRVEAITNALSTISEPIMPKTMSNSNRSSTSSSSHAKQLPQSQLHATTTTTLMGTSVNATTTATTTHSNQSNHHSLHDECDIIGELMGKYGKYQFYMTFLLSLFQIPNTFHIASPVYQVCMPHTQWFPIRAKCIYQKDNEVRREREKFEREEREQEQKWIVCRQWESVFLWLTASNGCGRFFFIYICIVVCAQTSESLRSYSFGGARWFLYYTQTNTHTHTQGALFDWQSLTFGLFNFSFKVNDVSLGALTRPVTGWCGEMAIACVYDHQKLVQGSATVCSTEKTEFPIQLNVAECTRDKWTTNSRSSHAFASRARQHKYNNFPRHPATKPYVFRRYVAICVALFVGTWHAEYGQWAQFPYTSALHPNSQEIFSSLLLRFFSLLLHKFINLYQTLHESLSNLRWMSARHSQNSPLRCERQ